MFDYSNVLDSASKSWLHENDLSKIQRGDFVYSAYVKSWGCHTGEEMSKKWHAATGTHMIGAIGKTQFMMEELPILTSENGKWVNYFSIFDFRLSIYHRDHAMKVDQLSTLYHLPLSDSISQSRAVHLDQCDG